MEREQFAIPMQDLEGALVQLERQSAEWHRLANGPNYRVCLESEASRRLLWTMCEQITLMLRTGADYSIPLILLAATMLETGYTIGRRQAETEVLEGWMKL